MKYQWTCQCCGGTFDSLPMDYAVKAPRNWFGIPEHERGSRARLTDDICTIDNSEHYVRGCIKIPVVNCSEVFTWGVWVSVSEQSLDRILELWDTTSVESEPPRFGWLSTWIAGYPEPVGVKCNIFIRPGTLRPRIVLEPTDYQLAVEQRGGITIDRVKEIAASAGLHST
jgi:hypothetical protein